MLVLHEQRGEMEISSIVKLPVRPLLPTQGGWCMEEVKDLYTATVRMIDPGDKLKIDQVHLETVIPAIGE